MGSAPPFILELCDSEFLDLNITWNTQQPRFSPCFRDTILVWLPAIIFAVCMLAESVHLHQDKLRQINPIPWNKFNIFRLFITFVLFLIKTTEAASYIYIIIFGATTIDNQNVLTTPVVPNQEQVVATYQEGKVLVVSSFLAPIIQATCHLVLIFVYYKQRKIGRHTSGPVWFYLVAALLGGLVDFYSTLADVRPATLNLVEFVVDLTHFPILLLLFILECSGDYSAVKSNDDPSDVRPESPELKTSFAADITFCWYGKFLWFGYKSRIAMTDLWKTLIRDKSSALVPLFRESWIRVNKKTKGDKYKLVNGRFQQANTIFSVLFKMFWDQFLFAASLKLLQDILQYTTPMILKQLLAFMSDDTDPIWHGVLFALLLLIVPSVQSLILSNYFHCMQLIGLHMKTMIIGAVYRKALVLSGSSRQQSTSGEIVNLMAVDSQRFQELSLYVNLIWSAPVQILLAIVLLYRELGWSIFAGVICMCLFLPANAYLANRIKLTQIKVMKLKDDRVKQMNELLGGIKVIKLYAWENSFIENLFAFRNRELSYLNRILNLDAVQTFLWQCSPFVVALVTFAVYVNADDANILDAEKAFVSISLFNLLRFPLTMLPNLVTSLVLTMVSAKRLNRFLNSNELIKYVTRNEELEAIAIEGGTLSWSQEDGNQDNGEMEKVSANAMQSATLKDIDLHVKPKQFVAIVGQVASGKSSLLASILGEMHRVSGRFNVSKSLSIAYVPQQAWIQNMTVRDNILFGSAYDEERYKQVLKVCCLQADLDTLPGGDQAEIGEKGINLSGGQKQRVSLARACYSNSDIFLLDDPLSALDSHVAMSVYEQVLSSSTGLLRNKTRVLATNSLFVLPHVDQIVVLDNGRVVECGTYRELMAIETGYLSEFMRQYSVSQESEKSQEDGPDTTKKSVSRQTSQDTTVTEGAKSLGGRTVSISEPTKSERDLKSLESIPQHKQTGDIGRLVEIEKIEMGSVDYKVYLQYFKAVSIIWISFVLLSLIGSTIFNVATNLWLSVWASDSEDPEKAQDTGLKTLRLSIYALFGGLQCFTVLTGSLALSRGAVRASNRLHASLLGRVMHSPMAFFDTTPIGRIVNRFAKDIDVVDSTIPGTFRSWINCSLQVISTLFVICYSFPTFFIIIIPLVVIYGMIQKIFIVTTRQLKRLESTTRSPIYSNFNETLSGISCIRAYNSVDRFVEYSDNLVDRNNSCSYPNIVANRWLSIRLEFFGNLITATSALFSVYYKGSIGAGVAGLTISYSLSITQTLSWLVRMTSDLETHIVSVERILEYMRNKQEDLWIKDDRRPPGDWPKEGAIQIQNYSTRYREDTDLVLKDLTIDIKPREKIGIVGRTGSGKSSLSLSLFRILEPSTGKIIIDGCNLTDYGLHDIRSKLTIIPQDPVLFSGSLRFNLDPLKLYTDLEIWRALELAHLKPYILTLENGLDYKVSEYGENFSVGQRQLICLARAILRKSRILILDEATASVDVETDNIVQKTIREIFSDCTIITIAHRLHTILDSDRILVLEFGHVKELDSPANLISNPNTAFASLVRDSRIDTSTIINNKKA